jgi:hypothetical protein
MEVSMESEKARNWTELNVYFALEEASKGRRRRRSRSRSRRKSLEMDVPRLAERRWPPIRARGWARGPSRTP